MSLFSLLLVLVISTAMYCAVTGTPVAVVGERIRAFAVDVFTTVRKLVVELWMKVSK